MFDRSQMSADEFRFDMAASPEILCTFGPWLGFYDFSLTYLDELVWVIWIFYTRLIWGFCGTCSYFRRYISLLVTNFPGWLILDYDMSFCVELSFCCRKRSLFLLRLYSSLSFSWILDRALWIFSCVSRGINLESEFWFKFLMMVEIWGLGSSNLNFLSSDSFFDLADLLDETISKSALCQKVFLCELFVVELIIKAYFCRELSGKSRYGELLTN